MGKKIGWARFHESLVRDIFKDEPEEEDVLCIMLLLHACQILLTDEVNVEGDVKVFAAITSRHASTVVAKLFKDKERRNYVHWYWKWSGEWAAYAILENVPPELMPRLRKIKELVEAHPWVEKLVDEDWTVIEDISRHSAP